LKFEDKPDYAFIRKMFREMFYKNNFHKDCYYDWTIILREKEIQKQALKEVKRKRQKERLLEEKKKEEKKKNIKLKRSKTHNFDEEPMRTSETKVNNDEEERGRECHELINGKETGKYMKSKEDENIEEHKEDRRKKAFKYNTVKLSPKHIIQSDLQTEDNFDENDFTCKYSLFLFV